jgi:hypothetical protein
MPWIHICVVRETVNVLSSLTDGQAVDDAHTRRRPRCINQRSLFVSTTPPWLPSVTTLQLTYLQHIQILLSANKTIACGMFGERSVRVW